MFRWYGPTKPDQRPEISRFLKARRLRPAAADFSAAKWWLASVPERIDD